MQRTDGFVVQPLSRADIRERTDQVRDALGIRTPRFPILDVIEWVLPEIWPDFAFEIIEPDEMRERFGPDTHGMTFPDELNMLIRRDVYEGAYRDLPLPRFSLTHEFGHLLMHGGVGMARRVALATPIYANSEWQADTFAGELLVSWKYITWDDTVASIARKFRVSHAAARTMFNVFKEEGLL